MIPPLPSCNGTDTHRVHWGAEGSKQDACFVAAKANKGRHEIQSVFMTLINNEFLG